MVGRAAAAGAASAPRSRREPDLRRRRQKAYALLARNGFTPDVCAAWRPTIAHRERQPIDEDSREAVAARV